MKKDSGMKVVLGTSFSSSEDCLTDSTTVIKISLRKKVWKHI